MQGERLPPSDGPVTARNEPVRREVGTFDDFYRREHAEQVRRAYLLTHSNEVANDVVHDAMLGLYRQWGSVDRPAAYLNRSVINGCRDAGRRNGRRNRLVERLRPIDSDRRERDVLDDVLERLPFNQRAAVVLRFYAGWTAEEIAVVLDCSPNSIGPWLSRAFDTMRKELS